MDGKSQCAMKLPLELKISPWSCIAKLNSLVESFDSVAEEAFTGEILLHIEGSFIHQAFGVLTVGIGEPFVAWPFACFSPLIRYAY